MEKIIIPEEITKQWQDEADKEFVEFYGIIRDGHQAFKSHFEQGYVFAKTSSYEREQKLIKSEREMLLDMSKTAEYEVTLKMEIQKLREREQELISQINTQGKNLSHYTGVQVEIEAENKKLQDQLNISQGAYDDLWAKSSDENYWIKENEKLQERIAELEEQIENLKTDYTLSIDRYNVLKNQIAKRDQLIKQAKPPLIIMRGRFSPQQDLIIDEWLKQVEELKEGK